MTEQNAATFLARCVRRFGDAAKYLAEQPFRILSGFPRNVSIAARFPPCPIEEDEMKKLGMIIAAVGTLALVLPSIASAETVVVRHGDHHHWDHGWHHGWDHHHHDRIVIKRHRD